MEPIEATTAAGILGRNTRYVRRNAKRIGGTKLSNGTWVFNRHTVEAYAKGLESD